MHADDLSSWMHDHVFNTGGDAGDTRITDLHVRRVGRSAYSCALTADMHDAGPTPEAIRRRLAARGQIVDSTFIAAPTPCLTAVSEDRRNLH